MQLIQKLLESLEGALAKYDENDDKFHFIGFSSKTIHLFGYDTHRFEQLYAHDALAILRNDQRQPVENALKSAIESKLGITIYSPVNPTITNLPCVEISGWFQDGIYYLLFGGISQETLLFENIANVNNDDIYVVDQSNYNLLYTNNLTRAFWIEQGQESPKCYQLLHGYNTPCKNCLLCQRNINTRKLHHFNWDQDGRFYRTRYQETIWNGKPAYIIYVRDTTEEIRVKREKERLETYFQTVLKYLPGGIAVVHHEVNGRLQPEYLSNGFAEMIDMPMEKAWDMYSTNALSGVHPDDQAYVKSHLDHCIQHHGEKETLQYRLLKGDGSYIWVNAKFSVIPLSQGDAMIFADYSDITKEKESQEKLRQGYRDQIFQHYLISDPNALILGHCNISKNKIIEIEDRTHSNLLELFSDVREDFFTGIGTLIEDEAERQIYYSKYLNEPSITAFHQGIKEILHQCYIKLPNATTGNYVQFKVNLVETPDTGDITGILTVSDITEKTITDKIMQQLSSLNYDLVANVNLFNDSYHVISGNDLDIGDTKGKQSQRVSLIAQTQVIENDRKLFCQMLDPDYVLAQLTQHPSYSFRYSIKNKNGEIFTKNMIVSAIDLRLGCVSLVRTDVTEMLAVEQEAKYRLQATLEQAHQANSAKNDFLSSMSHDIRTPMNAIVGMTTLAQANLNNPDKVDEYLNKISIASQHLLSLINDVLDMSQLDQNKIHLNNQPITIDELVDQIHSIMITQAQEKKINFSIQCNAINHNHFNGDLLRIKQILINLISNAIKFTPCDGSVTLTINELLPSDSTKVRYQFIVSDTGIGLKEDFMQHVFEPFMRSERVTKVEGTGLGLSITKGLVNLMNGTIQVTSKLHEGTTFTVELEFDVIDCKRHYTNETQLDKTNNILNGKHFLVAEDNLINSEILSELLQMHGATCTICENGQLVVEEFNNQPANTYDAIFMDIQMPVMNGYQATKKIRQLPRDDAKDITIIAMTANAFAQDVAKALESGMNSHIAKPIDMKLLANTLAKFLDY